MSLHRANKLLVDGKYIKILKSGTSNVYCVNADIVWTKRADKIVFAKFNAAVYLTANEQDEEHSIEIKKTFEKIIDVKVTPIEKEFIPENQLNIFSN